MAIRVGARQLHAFNAGPRLGVVARANDRTVARAGYGLVWIEQAGITTPFTTPVFPFLQTVSQRTLDSITPALILADGPRVDPIPLTPDAGLGQGVFAVDRDLGSGYVQQWNASLQRGLSANIAVEVAYIGSKITRVGIPDTNLNQLTVEQLAQGASLLQRVANPYFGIIPASSSLGDPDDSARAAAEAVPAPHDRQPLSQQRRHDDLSGLSAKLEQRLSHGLTWLVSYTRSTLDGRRVVGVRRLDPDRTGRQLPGGRQLQPAARARLLDRRHPACLRRVGGLGSARGT